MMRTMILGTMDSTVQYCDGSVHRQRSNIDEKAPVPDRARTRAIRKKVVEEKKVKRNEKSLLNVRKS